MPQGKASLHGSATTARDHPAPPRPLFYNPGDIGRHAAELNDAYFSAPPAGGGPVLTEWSPEGAHTNRLVYLHGYGDTPQAMVSLAKQLRLPQCDNHALQGWEPLPLGLEGAGWFPHAALLADLYGEPRARVMERDGCAQAVLRLNSLLEANRCKVGTTYLVGHGQGAELAVWAACARPVAGLLLLDLPLDAVLPEKCKVEAALAGVHVYCQGGPPGVGGGVKVHPALRGLPLLASGPAGGIMSTVKWFATHLPQEFLSLKNDPSVIKLTPS